MHIYEFPKEDGMATHIPNCSIARAEPVEIANRYDYWRRVRAVEPARSIRAINNYTVCVNQ
jgi:hypothetical protein